MVAYRDHCDTNIIEKLDFTDANEAVKFTNKLRATGGGD